ncbi:type I restriction endonuclease subunit R [Sulfitobacter sp. M368]|uniref:type I restriction endonuclease subunit R n=1 Tax=Sulfitobacter sp. M368 TaxID=2867021 RepID=UPI0021A62F0D|nr:type I restriction endonuclease subunit R [Sulfitobacter sp. M368]UWR15600.1 type I restriction endonuclease subunit R [Sulfitobacter sp. M368]
MINEDLVEQAALDILQDQGIPYLGADVISPDGTQPERPSYGEVLLMARLEEAVARLNPNIPTDARQDALRQVTGSASQSMIEENRRLHALLVNGVDVEFKTDDGSIRGDKVWLVDYEKPGANDWLVTNQFTVIEGKHNRRPDIVVFLNGLPVAVIELKNAASEAATIEDAFAQLQTYKLQIPSLFRTNAVLVSSDGLLARIGSLTANEERFMPWRSVTGSNGDFTPEGPQEMATLLKGVFDKGRFLELLRDFTVFGDMGDGPFKIIAGYHQFFGARKALASSIEASAPEGDRRIGVIWHTQGSGKSLLMAFFAGLLVRSPELQNPTLVVLTDRNDLDDQLFQTFAMTKDLIRQTPEHAESRDELRELLTRQSGGVIFTTMQKFSPEQGEEHYPALTDRRNVVVIADEAHRSQYGLDAKVNTKTGERKYGYAHYVRQALPNASFVGFTGTPIETADVNTPAVFGNYIDIYDITRAVEDKATVPIYYESRLARIELDDDEKPKIDDEIAAILEDESLSEQEKTKAKWSTVEALVGAEKRLKQVATDLVAHLEARTDALGGKAMVVCMSRRICVALYDEIVAQRPDWHSDDDANGSIKVVMTGSASDPLEWQNHIGSKKRRDDLAKRARDPGDPLKLVIVRDMWLTGFDAPCMHTMYIDKPMHGHGLMQAIARVNRVFCDKPGGLIVDYIGIAQNLKNALSQYSDADRERTGIDEEQAVALLAEKLDVVRNMFAGHDYVSGLEGAAQARLQALGDAVDYIVGKQARLAQQRSSDPEKKKELSRFQDATLELSRAFALASSSDLAKTVKDEVGFLQAVRAAMLKTAVKGKLSSRAKQFAIEQLVDKAVADAEIVDILHAAGIQTPDISILSDDFLLEIQSMERKNLALEALKKLLNGEIRSKARRNIVESRAFSERLEEAVARYHANAISTVEMIQTLIDLAKDVKASAARGEAEGMTDDELAFYDALAQNDSAVEAMGNEQLRLIAHELLEQVRRNVTVDWHKKESARARMRILVKRILKKFGYPPDLSKEAVQTVLEQAEALLKEVN